MNRIVGFAVSVVVMQVFLGCGSDYVLRGQAVEGEWGSVLFVGPDDGELDGAPVAHADVALYRDPTRPSRTLIASGRTDGAGRIAMPLSVFGAGWMAEQWLVEVVKPGYETIQQMVTLPRAKDGKIMLIVLRPGVSSPPEQPEDLWEEFRRFR